MTEKESAHPQPVNLAELSLAEPAGVSRPQEGGTDTATVAEEADGPGTQVGQGGVRRWLGFFLHLWCVKCIVC